MQAARSESKLARDAANEAGQDERDTNRHKLGEIRLILRERQSYTSEENEAAALEADKYLSRCALEKSTDNQ
jgi:hypothetical protein